jgi:hypothetical protein
VPSPQPVLPAPSARLAVLALPVHSLRAAAKK